ncbi:hypothetical protein QAD02_020117 [Eretmocerus hayati]|uniref:Uncharacterized protein n=1 Tax=Eretmocerus hayati TaxID=131215 RepID=A0ACC2PL68_9HYME|nr:hypothetical protein QAD02_020117 [Eretmocerus hayati]
MYPLMKFKDYKVVKTTQRYLGRHAPHFVAYHDNLDTLQEVCENLNVGTPHVKLRDLQEKCNAIPEADQHNGKKDVSMYRIEEAGDDHEEEDDDASNIDLIYIDDRDNDVNIEDKNIEDEIIEDEIIEDENMEDDNIEDENIEDDIIEDENVQEAPSNRSYYAEGFRTALLERRSANRKEIVAAIEKYHILANRGESKIRTRFSNLKLGKIDYPEAPKL